MRGYEVVAAAVRAVGVETVFGLLGNSNLATVGVLARSGVRFVGSRHESGAVSMAAGHAWATGEPTLCTVTHGPGLANALTALTSAARDRLPLVLLVGDIRHQPAWQAQRADQPSMLSWTGARLIDGADPSGLAAVITDAFRTAATERRPVVVTIPANLLDQPAVRQRPPAEPETEGPRRPEPEASTVQRAAEALATAKRPVVLGGRGAVWSGAGPELREVAAACGGLLTTTLPALGLFAGDPYDLGVCGGYSTRTARELLRQADCVLAVGAGLNGYTTASNRVFPDATIIHCDIDHAAFGRYTDVDLRLPGDARSVARQLLRHLGEHLGGDTGHGQGYRTDPGLADRIAASRRGADYPDHSSPRDGIDPRVALVEVDQWLLADRQVVIDLGHFSTFPSQILGMPEAGRFYPALGFGSVGLGVAAAIGAAVGRPVPTVAVVGDGGALMSLGEFESLARHRPPVTVVVLNDHAYGAEIHHLHRYGLTGALADFPLCDLAAVAAALGLPGGTARTREELSQLLRRLPAGGPAVVDVRVTRATVADRFTGAGH